MTLELLGTPNCLVSLIGHFYECTQARVRMDKIRPKSFDLKKRGLDRAVSSALLFYAYIEVLMGEVMDEWKGEISIDGKRITNLRYTDDTSILTSREEVFAIIMEKLERIGSYSTKKNQSHDYRPQ